MVSIDREVFIYKCNSNLKPWIVTALVENGGLW